MYFLMLVARQLKPLELLKECHPITAPKLICNNESYRSLILDWFLGSQTLKSLNEKWICKNAGYSSMNLPKQDLNLGMEKHNSIFFFFPGDN